MKKYSRLFYFYVIARLLALPTTGWGSSGTEGASFLNIPVGARPAAMGSAYTPLAEDAYAPVWNPAGLGFVDANEIAGQHLSYLESIHYEYLGAIHPFAQTPGSSIRRAMGLSMQYLGSGDIPGTDEHGDPIGNFTAHYGSYNLAYGQSLSDKLAIGAAVKWINAKLADVSANAVAFDLGSLYKMSRRLTLGATLTNMGNRLKFLSEGDSLPLALHMAAAFQVIPQVLLSSEVIYPKTGLAAWRGGLEWTPMDLIALRVGYRTDNLKGLSPLAGMSTGLGLKLWGGEFAYAWVPYGELGNTQYFSLGMRFGAAAEKKRNLIQYQTIKEHRTVEQKDKNGSEYQDLMELLRESPKDGVAQKDSPTDEITR